MKHEFKNNDGVDEFRVGLSTGKCELKCLKCGNWIRVAPDNMSWVEGCPGERNLKAVYEERVEQSLADKPLIQHQIDEVQGRTLFGAWHPIMKVVRRLIWWAIAMGAVWLLYKVLGLNFF